jgi:hypothetical protein
MLLEYVENLAGRIISEKEMNGIAPASASFTELQRALNEDLLECMRQLHGQHKFKGIRQGVNSIPALVRF